MQNVLIGIRQAARVLRRNRGFAATAVLALSLGIAACTAIFSVANKVLLDPLPYPDPGRLVQLVTRSQLGNQNVVSIPKYAVWRDHTTVFQAIAAYDFAGPNVNLTARELLPLALSTARVSADYFRLFGASVIAGGTFSNADDQPGAPCAAVISSHLWRTRFKSSPILVGSSISLDHEPCRVIGVLSPAFTAEKPVDVWLPIEAGLYASDQMNRVRVAARLKAGVTVEMAAADVAKTMDPFLFRYPQAPLLFLEEFTAIPLRDALVGDVRPALFLLTGAVCCVLLIACANVGSLVLARAARRASEIAVRSALGASRSQLIRQLLIESMLIALLSAALGLLLGFSGVRFLLQLSPADLPRVGANGSAIALDWRVFLFALAVSVLSGLLCGLLPAISASRPDVMCLVNDSPPQSGMGFRRSGKRAFLVISEVALALVLLVGAGLLIRTFVAGRATDRGFDEQHVLTLQMSLNGPQFERTDQVAELVQKVQRRMRRAPGIVSVATTSSLPLEPGLTMPFTVTNHDQTMVGRYHGAAVWRSVSPDFFAVFRIHLLRGRLFSNADDAHHLPVVLINRRMMRKFWPEVDANAVGDFIIIGKGASAEFEDAPRQIVGVVDDVREAGLDRDPMMFVPVAQLSDGMNAWNNRVRPITWAIRTSDDDVAPALVAHDLREASGLPLGQVRTMHQVIAASSARAQFYVLLLSVFGVVALLLAAVGLYGLMSYTVQQRTREIGLRMALGAAPHNIRNMVIWQGMRLALIGIGAGIPAALALTRVMMSILFGVKPSDPAVVAGVAALLVTVALLAAYFPSVRAIEVSPSDSLRH